METTAERAVAVVGVGAILPDAPDAAAFRANLTAGRYSISEVPPERWDQALYYDPDPAAPDKTYSKIGGWVREFEWDPLGWRLPIPPRVGEAMDRTQKWAVAGARAALADYGWPDRPLDPERTAVVLGNAMAGDRHYLTALRIMLPEVARELERAPGFAALPPAVRAEIEDELRAGVGRRLPPITEDTMPGELANIIAGRIAALFDFRGPNFVCDAACASAMAALGAAVEGLTEHDFDAVVTGGVDGNMSASTFTKFCKIGALSGTGTRPYDAGADGFVMGEGAAVLLLKRLADAERDGDRVYAVVRGLGGSSDGKGKGITAPNPLGQRLAVERAWRNAGLSPATCGLIEGHGTSTRVGDVAEVESLCEAFAGCDLAPGSIPLGSVKSNVGHLKGAAGAAGLLKAIYALDGKVLPPSLNCVEPNPKIDFPHTPFYVNTELRPWDRVADGVRRAGVSAFGFGGTNFHAVLEEHVPGRLTGNGRRSVAVGARPRAAIAAGTGGAGAATAAAGAAVAPAAASTRGSTARPPLRGALLLGAASAAELVERLRAVLREAEAGRLPAPPAAVAVGAPHRLAIDYADATDLAVKAAKALKAAESGGDRTWHALRAQGIFRGEGPAGKLAFLYTGQGSQYVNMLAELRARDPGVAATFAEADQVMAPLLGRPLTDFIFRDPADEATLTAASEQLRQTEITQPAVLAVDVALTRWLAGRGIEPDFVIGHSLGEYGALVAAGCLPFDQALEAVSARGREMARVAVDDCGWMAAVSAPLEEVERTLAAVDGYAVVANLNSTRQAVIGGATDAVREAMERFREAGYAVQRLPVSHAFHTEIVAPASAPLRRQLARFDLRPPRIPVVANVSGDFYPSGDEAVPEMIEILGRQIASPVQFVQGLRTLYENGARVFVEVGPKRALQGFVEDVLGREPGVSTLFTNHPKVGDVAAAHQALCGLWAAGLGAAGLAAGPAAEEAAAAPAPSAARGPAEAGEPVVVTGAALGLPGTPRVFDDRNLSRILHGEQFIDTISLRFRRAMVDKHVTRLVKSDQGGPRFETIDHPAEAIKLAARRGRLDLVEEFGYPADRAPALDVVSALAIGAGLDALHDAGIPLVQHYKTTTKGTRLPDRWGLPRGLRDDTGVIFASAFPGVDSFADETERYHTDLARRRRLAELEEVRRRAAAEVASGAAVLEELDRRLHEVRAELAAEPYRFDRRFLFRLLAMGHSQFAELIGARGPNTQINAACSSTTQAVGLAEDWIRAGRCRRVVVISADDVTSDHLIEWIGAGFLATGAAATDETVEDAAIPFDRRRHGMIVGMGAAAIVVESAEAARERGLQPICELLGTVSANSAYHGTRLDVDHIRSVVEELVAAAEERWGIDRREIAPATVFFSHETYTPARGGSAQAEVDALRHVFGADADRIVIANTKGFTGHPMAVGIEDVVAIKSLETGLVPPVANFKEVDPELGRLNLSQGGFYPVRYALRLGAGFGSQISLSLMRQVAPADGRRRAPDELGHEYRIVDPAAWQAWLEAVSGYDTPRLEVEKRTLRVADQGPTPVLTAAASRPAAAATTQAAPAAPGTAAAVAAEVAVPAAAAKPPAAIAAQTPAAPAVVPPAPAPPTAAARPAPGAAPATGASPPAAPAAAPPAESPVAARVLEIVAAQTGYPTDMLDLDLDLEADLGIDTVKQAETFAAIRREWDIPRDDALNLRDFPTLGHAIQFVYQRRPDLAPGAGTPGTGGTAGAATPRSTGGEPRAAVAPAPAAQPAAPEVTETPVAPPAPGDDPVAARVLEIVAAQTGYPTDMLDLDLDLEADLGIDTVKQAETFAAIRREWDIPRDDTLDLRSYPTLAHAIRFVHDRRPDLAAGRAPVAAGAALGAIPRRVPVPVLRPPLARCKPTGVRLETGTRVVLAPDRGGVGAALTARLEKRGVEVLVVDPDGDAGSLASRLEAWREEGAVGGVYWLPALDDEGDLAALDQAAFRAEVDRRVKRLHLAARLLYDALGAPGSFLVSATRLGGRHGCDAAGATAPLGGAVAGFTKAFKRERPLATVKVVDFPASRKTAALADLLIEETLADPGAVEVGYAADLRWTVGLAERPPAGEGVALGAETVFAVTGAAGGIVSAIVADLAAASAGTFYLLDLAAEPDPGDPDLDHFTADREGLRRDLFERIGARGERATPAKVDRELAAIERRHAAREAIRAVERAGGTARYRSLDLRDAAAVERAVSEIAEAHGRIDVLIHAAGLEVSHLLTDKGPEEFDRVFDVKAEGWHNLLRAARGLPLGATVVFSSIAGRFGNAGQTDYSAANELLAKSSSALRRTRPETRAVILDWSAWAGIGMATRGSIPRMMERAGIDMLPPEAAIPVVRRELQAGTRGEVVVAQGLGALLEEWDATGGLDPAAVTAAPPRPLIGEVVAMDLRRGLVVETELDPRRQPFLNDHRIDGTAVLPGVMGIEAFAEAAGLLFPGWRVAAVEDVEFLTPFKFYRDQPRRISVEAVLAADGGGLIADCRLVGRRTLPAGGEPAATTHFTARVRLAREPAEVTRTGRPEAPAGAAVGAEQVYGPYFHGPAYRVVESAWRAGEAIVGRMPATLPADHLPEEAPTVLDPRQIELCFQTAGLWELGREGRMGLPQHIDRVRVLPRREVDGDGPIHAVVRPHADGSAFDAEVVDDSGTLLLQVEGYRTIPLPGAVPEAQLAPLRAAVAGA